MPSTSHIQASDVHLASRQRHVLPGRGDVDLPAFVAVLPERNFR